MSASIVCLSNASSLPHSCSHTGRVFVDRFSLNLVTIQAAMGHSAIATASRYVHAKPATEQAEIFTRAFTADTA